MDFAWLGVMVLGILYLLAYVWPWWPWTARLNTSGEAVGFLYFFLGGYAFMRARAHRHDGDGGTNVWIGYVLLPVAVWDLVSPFVLRDLHPMSIVAHLVGGAVALACIVAGIRACRREPVLKRRSTVRGA